MDARVEMKGVSKAFPGTKALDNVDFQAAAGEIHALMGENGAGKSTLIKILTGVLRRDSGEILLEGKPVDFADAGAARAAGVAAVYQEVNLVRTMSVTRNLVLGREPKRFGLVDWRSARRQTLGRISRLGVDVDVEKPLGAYSVAVQQLIAIARALDDQISVLVLDEPTASLDATETERLFSILRDLKGNGLAIVFISHFVDQVYAISDRITVLRNGRRVGASPTANLPRLELVSLMLGKELREQTRRDTGASTLGDPLLVATGLGRKKMMAPFDLTLRAREAVGLSGLLGSGRTETAKLIFGADRTDTGTVSFGGSPLARRSPGRSIAAGIAFCPEDRKAEGLVLELSVRENIVLALQSKRGWLRRVSRPEQDRIAREMISALAIATPDAEKPVGLLSGGNQQKVVLARALASSPKALILDEPTRGIDVGAHAEIIALIRKLCAEGLALLVASSEIEELVAVCDRVAVLRDRRMIGELTGDEVTRDSIVQKIAGA
jgi:galactofuranose transport system ATP-binding protein